MYNLYNMLRLYMLIPCTETLGPYKRFAVWIQGCLRQCNGCMSPESRYMDGGELVLVDSLAQSIINTPDVEGVTISGGEPFLQSGALINLIQLVRQKRDLGVIIYTGYLLSELQEESKIDESIYKLLNVCDLLIDAPYIEELNDGLSLRGSSNQTVHALSKRYESLIDIYYGTPNRKVEWHLNKNNMAIVGIPGKSALNLWMSRKIEGEL